MRKSKINRLILPRNHYRCQNVFAGNIAQTFTVRERAEELPSILNKTENDIILFEGGTDVSPDFYGESRNWRTEQPDRRRDLYERELFNRAVVAGCPMIGICRGAQLITALYGGKLIQHVTNHEHSAEFPNGGHHTIMCHDGEWITANSIHHQMMNPFVLPRNKFTILAHTKKGLSTCYWGADSDIQMELPDDFVEPEIVWYPEIKALCIQGHPEFSHGSAYRKYCIDLARSLIVNGERLQSSTRRG